ncbi:MAG: hypothetical protein LBS61_03245 [Endomicrobium sp.]|jgi:hypothetical protein|nr:hypothetical protein [Endomicrobium sp.]
MKKVRKLKENDMIKERYERTSPLIVSSLMRYLDNELIYGIINPFYSDDKLVSLFGDFYEIYKSRFLDDLEHTYLSENDDFIRV